jgi:hypothetical protein
MEPWVASSSQADIAARIQEPDNSMEGDARPTLLFPGTGVGGAAYSASREPRNNVWRSTVTYKWAKLCGTRSSKETVYDVSREIMLIFLSLIAVDPQIAVSVISRQAARTTLIQKAESVGVGSAARADGKTTRVKATTRSLKLVPRPTALARRVDRDSEAAQRSRDVEDDTAVRPH